MIVLQTGGFLNEWHWFIMSALFFYLSAYCLVHFIQKRKVSLAMYTTTTSAIFGICISFWAIQVKLFNIDPVILFVIERGLWWLVFISLFGLTTSNVANLEGKHTITTKIYLFKQRFMQRRMEKKDVQ